MQDVAQSVDDSKGKKVLDWLSAAFFFQPLSPVMLQLCLPAAPCTDNRPRHSGTMYDILVRWLNCLLLCCALEVSSDVRKPFFKRMEKKKNFLKRKVAQLCTKEIVMHRDCKWIAKNFWNTFQCDAKCLWMKVCSSVMSVVGLFLPVLSFLLCCFFFFVFFSAVQSPPVITYIPLQKVVQTWWQDVVQQRRRLVCTVLEWECEWQIRFQHSIEWM